MREKTVPDSTETKCEISDDFGNMTKPKFNCSAVHSEESENLKRKILDVNLTCNFP